jgi:histone-lysine N-methyltransferase SETMAR
MFATSAREVVPRTKQNISAKKTMVIILCTSTRLLVLTIIPKSTEFKQDYFINTVLPNLSSERRRIARRKGLRSFLVHMDNPMYHNGAKITEKLEKKHIARAPHPPYSSDLGPCDFWLFGILKQKMKERVFQSEEQNLAAITESWNELTFEDIQRVFQNWMERLTWVIANGGKYY